MATFTRADMLKMYRLGILNGLGCAEAYMGVDSEDAANKIVEEGFENCLARIKEEKTPRANQRQGIDADKAIEQYRQGKSNQPPIPEIVKEK